MTLRKLTPAEEAVFDVIVKERENNGHHGDSVFYAVSSGQKSLVSNGSATKYGIGEQEQNKIIRKLAKDGIIRANWVTRKINDTEFEFAYNDDEEDLQSIFWTELMLSDGNAYEGCYFIKIGFDQIKKINDACRACYICKLSYDDTKYCFVVECSNKKYIVKRLMSDGRPFEVLKYALKKYPEPVTRRELSKKEGNLYVSNKESIATIVFPPNNVVHHELKPFIEDISSESICVNPAAKLTRVELENIKKS